MNLALQTPLPRPVMGQVPMPPPWVTMPPQTTLLMALGLFAACTIILTPLFRALGRRIEGRTTDHALRSELDQMQARLGEVDALQHRLLDLEERLDFAERMLAQKREPDRLGRGP
jgi:Tfp pilus assembly protein PilO